MGDEHRLGLLDRGERSAVDRSARSIARINCRADRADCSPTDAGMRIAATIVFQTNGTTPRTSSPGRSGSGGGIRGARARQLRRPEYSPALWRPVPASRPSALARRLRRGRLSGDAARHRPDPNRRDRLVSRRLDRESPDRNTKPPEQVILVLYFEADDLQTVLRDM